MRSLLHRFDSTITRYIQVWPASLRPLMKVASFLGYPFVTLGVVACGILGFSWIFGNAHYIYVSAIIFATHGIGSLLKLTIGRPRPVTYITKRWHLKTHSFPSGHATGSAVAYGAIAVIMASSGILGIGAAVFPMLFVGLIGVSRIYLGAHYPSDVFAGWALGGMGVYGIVLFLQNS